MKIYTAQIQYDYEGFSIVGVFSTKKAAIKFFKLTFPDPEDRRGDYREVWEYEVDGETKAWGSVGTKVWTDPR